MHKEGDHLLKLPRRGDIDPSGACGSLLRPGLEPASPRWPSSGRAVWRGRSEDILSRHCLTLASLMDSVISPGPLSADRQSGRRWQVTNTLLAERLRWGPATGVPGRRDLRDRKSGVEPDVLDFSHSLASKYNLQKSWEMEGFPFCLLYEVWTVPYWGSTTAGPWPSLRRLMGA